MSIIIEIKSFDNNASITAQSFYFIYFCVFAVDFSTNRSWKLVIEGLIGKRHMFL